MTEQSNEVPETVEVSLNMVNDIISTSESLITRANDAAVTLYGVNVYYLIKGNEYEGYKDGNTWKEKKAWKLYASGLFDNPSKMVITLATKEVYKFECTKLQESSDRIYSARKADTGKEFFSYPFTIFSFINTYDKAKNPEEWKKVNDWQNFTAERNRFQYSDEYTLTQIKDGYSYVRISTNSPYALSESEGDYFAPSYELQDPKDEKSGIVKTKNMTKAYVCTESTKDGAKLHKYIKRWYPGFDRWYGELEDFEPKANGVVNIDMKRTSFAMNFNVASPVDGKLTVSCDSVCDFVVKPSTTKIQNMKSFYSFKDVSEVHAAACKDKAYEHKFTIFVTWERTDGSNTGSKNIFSKEVTVANNKMLNINIDVNGLANKAFNIKENDVITEMPETITIE